MTQNYRKFFFLALVLALVAAGIAGYAWHTMMSMIPIAKAGADILPEQQTTPQNVIPGRELKGSLHADTVKDPIELKDMVAKGFIPAGTTLRKSMFQPVSATGVAARLEPGQVAVAVPANIQSTCGGTVKKGSQVDLLVTSKTATEVVGHRITVLDVTVKKDGGSDSAVILALTDQQGKLLTSTMSKGSSPVLFLRPVINKEVGVEDAPVLDNNVDLPGSVEPDGGHIPAPEPVITD